MLGRLFHVEESSHASRRGPFARSSGLALAFGAVWSASFGCAVAIAQGVPPPGPGPRLTTARAIADLTSARIITPRLTLSANQTISARDFADLLVRTLDIDVPKTLALAAATPATPALAVAAIERLRVTSGTSSFANASAPILREDAVGTALNAAARVGRLQRGPRTGTFAPFADDADFAAPGLRAMAHLAVYAGLATVSPDDFFFPRRPLRYGDAAYLLDAIRLAAHGEPQE